MIDGSARIEPISKPLTGSVHVPGDKSISHRAVLFSAMAEGTSHVSGLLDSLDVRSSIAAVEALGAHVDLEKQPNGSLAGEITGWGASGPKQPDAPIDCGNSGTTARLLMGILAQWPIRVTITGDESLRQRPMRRITAPLMKMGVDFDPAWNEHLPITEIGDRDLKAITYSSPMASAQLKTAVLIAGLGAKGTTTLNEPAVSRNHTELMLPEFGATTTAGERTASVEGPKILEACNVHVPGDPSSAAYAVCAALLKPGSNVQVEDVSLNRGRIGFVRVLEHMGADISVKNTGTAGKEPYGVISVRYTPNLRGCEIRPQWIARTIDEIPVLTLVAAHAQGVTVFREVGELKVKETNRLAAAIEGLELLGIDAWTHGEDLYIQGDPEFQISDGLVFDSHKDHRLAMTWALVGLCKNEPVTVENFDSVKTSFPEFLETLQELTR